MRHTSVSADWVHSMGGGAERVAALIPKPAALDATIATPSATTMARFIRPP
jgi:hypothetical protein